MAISVTKSEVLRQIFKNSFNHQCLPIRRCLVFLALLLGNIIYTKNLIYLRFHNKFKSFTLRTTKFDLHSRSQRNFLSMDILPAIAIENQRAKTRIIANKISWNSFTVFLFIAAKDFGVLFANPRFFNSNIVIFINPT